jgi:predicted transcriptional regulator
VGITVIQVKDVMRETLNTITADATVLDATKIMGTSSYAIILEKGTPIGIVTRA